MLAAASKMRTSSSSCVSTILSQTSLIIQPHKQKYNGFGSGYSNSCASVTIQNATRVHMNSFSQNLLYDHPAKYSLFSLNHIAQATIFEKRDETQFSNFFFKLLQKVD
jgi:hypothetical protein